MKIGIYGGAFNPIHYGHLRTALDVLETLCLDRIIFIPSGKTPFDKPDLAGAVDRYEMVKMAIKGNRRFAVSDSEVKKRGKTYTIDTIKGMAKDYPGAQLYFILGIDAFLDLPDWKHPEKLTELANLVVISRPGFLFAEIAPSPFLKRVLKKILRDIDRGRRKEFSFEISKTRKGILCRVTNLNISSSDIRGMLKSGKDIKYLLPDSIKSYIISHNLYKNNK
jgi:nicotinate-nucleotide adenylyltransferase